MVGNRVSRKRVWANRNVITTVVVIAAVLLLAVGPVAADHGDCDTTEECEKDHLRQQMNNVGNFLSIVIGAVAVPNGAFGVFQWMTAGTDTEQSDKGRKRIRNSFIGVAGAGAVMIAVRMLSAMI